MSQRRNHARHHETMLVRLRDVGRAVRQERDQGGIRGGSPFREFSRAW